jgi:hypothetical protein
VFPYFFREHQYISIFIKQFINTIKRMGIDDVLEVYEAALDRAYASGLKDGFHTLDEFKP